MTDTEQKIKLIVLTKLADHIGVESEDINLDDGLIEDLHLNPAEITDFLQKLSEDKIEIKEDDLEEIETVSDLIDHILSQREII